MTTVAYLAVVARGPDRPALRLLGRATNVPRPQTAHRGRPRRRGRGLGPDRSRRPGGQRPVQRDPVAGPAPAAERRRGADPGRHRRRTSPASPRTTATVPPSPSTPDSTASRSTSGHNYLLSAFLEPQAQPPHRPVGRERWPTGPASRSRWSRPCGTRWGTGPRSRPNSTWPTGCTAGSGWRRASSSGGCWSPTEPSTPSNSPAGARCPTRCSCSGARRHGRSSPPPSPRRCGPGSGWSARASSQEYPFEEAYFLPYARQFLDALSLAPHPARWDQPAGDRARRALAEGFSFVAMARALLREPDLVGRWERGAADDGLCIHCNKCMPTIYSGTRCVLVPHPRAHCTTDPLDGQGLAGDLRGGRRWSDRVCPAPAGSPAAAPVRRRRRRPRR